MKGKRRPLEPIGAVLRRHADLRVPPSIDAPPVAFRDWEAAVGSRIAARARPVRLDRGVLLVRAASATWAQELSLLSDAIIAQLRARGVRVSSLRFRVGQVDAPERPPSREEVREEPPEVELPEGVQMELGRVSDTELRAAIARAAAKNLGWQAARRPATTSAHRGARAPRSAASETARPARSSPPTSGARRHKS